jgi:hypothetical protein
MVNDPPFADDIRNKSKAIIERVRQMKKRNLRIAQRRLAK